MKFSVFEKAHVIHRGWRYRRRTEPGPMRFVLEHVKPGQVVLDIGANKGAYTYSMCRRVGPAGRVIAFEPQPKWADYIRSMGQAFGFRQLAVVPAGLSSSTGRRRLLLPAGNPVGGASFEESDFELADSMTVETRVLDEVLDECGARPVALIKCDVEGHEYEVFRGAMRTLREDRPVLVFECQDFRHPDGQIGRVFGMLEALGYEGSFFDDTNCLRPIAEFDPAVHQADYGGNYCDNFVFQHAGSC